MIYLKRVIYVIAIISLMFFAACGGGYDSMPYYNNPPNNPPSNPPNSSNWDSFMPYENMTSAERAAVIEYLQSIEFFLDLADFSWRADYDDDGLTNLQEYEHRTDLFSADTDGDGLSDYNEVFVYNTNPLKTDSDDDGLPDGLEKNTL